ncbi:MAG: 4Fe-4S binding protein, partial [Acidobacteria bacterium]|nr:4Fe-4S binding protein [Acidobacteriota bacterium]
MRWRRASQAAFLMLFCWWLFRQTANPFFTADPLAAVSNGLAARTLARGLLWSLLLLIPTFFFGRFFCGWICPLGTLHHLLSHFGARGRKRLEGNRYQPWQRLKYGLLLALVAAAAAGSALAGLMDPFALLAKGAGALALHPPHLSQGFVLAALLAAILAVNVVTTRFWCRALCPLGALLGAASRWSLLGLEKPGGGCEDCRRCLLHCQGGDDPIPGARWRKAE